MASTHRVIRFRIGDEQYCISVDELIQVEDKDDPRTVPNAPEFSVGVQEFRGDPMEVLDPKTAFDIRGEADENNVVMVLDEKYKENDRLLGWQVDEILEVETITREDVDESVEEEGVIAGVEFDDGYAVWLDPAELFLEEIDYVIDEE